MYNGVFRPELLVIFRFFFVFSFLKVGCSDTMGNKGAFITLEGQDMEPKYTTYEAVVSYSFFFIYLGWYDFCFSRIQTSNRWLMQILY